MKLRIILILAILMLSGITNLPSPESTTEKEHPFAKHLASIYFKYLKSAKEGDVSSALSYMIEEYASMSAVITPELLKGMSSDELDPKESIFIKVDASKNTARLIYHKTDEVLKSWQAVIFKLESEKWKIAKIVKYGKNLNSEEDVFTKLIDDTNSYFDKND